MQAVRYATAVVFATFAGACAAGGPLRTAQAPTPATSATTPVAREEQTAPIETIAPDRPDVTNGTNIVEGGLLQLEVGVQHAWDRGTRTLGTPVTFRLGLSDWFEARLGTDGFLRQADGQVTAGGAGNVQLAAKMRLFADPGGVPVLSVLPAVDLPVASAEKGPGSGDTDWSLIALSGTDIGQSSHIDVNYGISVMGAGSGRPHFAQHLVSASLSHNLTGPLSPYVERFWFSRLVPDGGQVVSADAGFIDAFITRWAVDAGVAIGLSGAASDVSAFSGVSVIVGDVLGQRGVIARQRRAARARARARTKG